MKTRANTIFISYIEIKIGVEISYIRKKNYYKRETNIVVDVRYKVFDENIKETSRHPLRWRGTQDNRTRALKVRVMEAIIIPPDALQITLPTPCYT